eukprot:jgi/Mesen1/10010/ME000722S09293
MEERARAVLWWCLHAFCGACIQRWSRVSRACPLCKGEFVGWYFNIRGAADYDEHVLPKLRREGGRAEGEGAAGEAAEGGGQLAQLSWAYEPDWAALDRWRARRPAGRRLHPYSHHRPRQHGPAAEVVPGGSISGPRPYYYRLQRALLSSSAAASSSTAEVENTTRPGGTLGLRHVTADIHGSGVRHQVSSLLPLRLPQRSDVSTPADLASRRHQPQATMRTTGAAHDVPPDRPRGFSRAVAPPGDTAREARDEHALRWRRR